MCLVCVLSFLVFLLCFVKGGTLAGVVNRLRDANENELNAQQPIIKYLSGAQEGTFRIARCSVKISVYG